jgi:hypothetical protein
MTRPLRPTTPEAIADTVADGPWQFTDPRRDNTTIPYTDADSAELIDQAATALVLLRAPMALGDAATTISVLVSLAAEANDRLHDAAADARDQGYTWDQIAERLATTATTARRRHSAYSTWRAEQPPEPTE